MWPFDIFAKRRAREAQKQREEHDQRMQRIKDSIEAANRRQRAGAETISHAQQFRAAAAQGRPTLRAVPSSSPAPQVSAYDDPLSPINPLSPLNPSTYYTQSMLAPADEPRHTSSHCDTSSSHSSHSHSDHSHSSSDYSCSSSSYDSGSSSSSSDF